MVKLLIHLEKRKVGFGRLSARSVYNLLGIIHRFNFFYRVDIETAVTSPQNENLLGLSKSLSNDDDDDRRHFSNSLTFLTIEEVMNHFQSSEDRKSIVGALRNTHTGSLHQIQQEATTASSVIAFETEDKQDSNKKEIPWCSSFAISKLVGLTVLCTLLILLVLYAANLLEGSQPEIIFTMTATPTSRPTLRPTRPLETDKAVCNN